MAELLRATDVFGITRTLPMNYVTREAVDGELVLALTRDQHLVIFGSSKQGKTSVRKYNLKDEECIVVTCGNRWNLGTLHSTILKNAGYSVVQSETRAVSGNYKITATAKVKGGFLGIGAEAGMDGESGEGSSTSVTETRLELDPFDVNDVISALAEMEFSKWIVLEDFHYLPEDTQKDFAVALKAFHESSDLTFIVVGVWLQENRLIQFNGDLSGRITTVNADRWSTEELQEAISLGEQHLNIEFDKVFRADLVASCFDSIYVVQEACLQACLDAGVSLRQEAMKSIGEGKDARDVVARVVDKQSARYSDFLMNFATGFGETDLEMYKWLLAPVLAASPAELEKGMHYRVLRRRLGEVHPRGSQLNAGNVTQALKSLASLQVQQSVKPLVLDYDQSLKILNVVDRSFLIWLGHQDRKDLFDHVGLPSEILDKLVDNAPTLDIEE